MAHVNTTQISQAIEEWCEQALTRRKPHERRWYDNNFFDDGYHFRTISKKTGKVVDQTSRNSHYVERAIPRASRQIRGVANLLFAAEPYPVVYPERVSKADFDDAQQYMQEMEKAKQIARRRGTWLSTEWVEQELDTKLIDMILLAAKNSLSWMQVYSNPGEQEIITDVYDAFDIICYGDLRDHEKLPFITKSCPMDIQQIQTSPLFDAKMVAKLSPDNKYATSSVKNAYMLSRYGSKETEDKRNGTVLVKETFIKDYLTEDNWKQAVKLGSDTGAMEGKSKGDMIMRHVFSADGSTLNDEYVDYDNYPLVPYRFEPGPLYQVPFIERFIPQNKSLDVILTRLEKWVNSMVVGVYMNRKGENFNISNIPGGQKVEYESTPPTQMQTSSVGATPFQVIELLNKFLEEQGSTTAALGQIPSGVKSGVAIESVKATEYANLKFPTLMLKKTIKGIAERMLERAHKDYLKPKEVESLEDGEPDYFDVIGKRGKELSEKLDVEIPEDTIVLDKDTKVRVEIEPGLGLTMDGKRQAMEAILNKIIEISKTIPNSIPPEALQQIIKKFLEQFGYGSTQELMEALDEGMRQGDMNEEQIMKMKVAIIEALRDSGAVGPEMEKRLVDSTKVGVMESLKDSGLLDKQEQPQQEEPNKVSISYKDLPPEGQVQAAARAGIQLDANQIRQDMMQDRLQERQMKDREMSLKEKAANKPNGVRKS